MAPIRPNRRSRTRVPRMQRTEGASVRSKITPRATPDYTKGAGAKSAALAESMQSFIQPIQTFGEIRQRQALDGIEQENRELAVQAENAALRNPKKAAEAIAKGEMDAFAPNADALSRRSFIETFKITTGKALAGEDYASEFQNRLRTLDFATGDPRAVRDEVMDQSLGDEGDPLFQAAYKKAFMGAAEKDIQNWLGSQSAFHQAKAFDRRMDVMASEMGRGKQFTAREFSNVIADSMNSSTTAEGKIGNREAAAYRIFFNALSSDNTSALEAIHQPDPEHDGLSLADRFKEQFQKAQSSAISDINSTRTVEQQQDFIGIEDMMRQIETEGVATVETEDGTRELGLNDVMRRLYRNRQKYGWSPKWSSLADGMADIYAENATKVDISEAAQSCVATGECPFITTSDMNDYGQSMVNAVTQNRQPREAAAAIATLATRYSGLGKDVNAQFEHDLLNTGDTEKMTGTFNQLETIVAADNGKFDTVDSMLSSQHAKDKFKFLHHMTRARGMNPGDAALMFEEADEAVIKPEPLTEYVPKSEDQQALIDSTISMLDDKNPELNVGGFSDTAATGQVRGLLERELSRTFGLMSAHNATIEPEDVAEMTASAVSGQLSLGLNANGEKVISTVKPPRVLIDPSTGKPTPVKAVTSESLDMAAEQWENSPFAAFDGEFAGVMPDPFGTPRGYGYQVTMRDPATGVANPVILEKGQTYEAEMTEGAEVSIGEQHPAAQAEFKMIRQGENGNMEIQIPEDLSEYPDGYAVDEEGHFRLYQHPTRPEAVKMYWAPEYLPTPEEVRAKQAKQLESQIQELKKKEQFGGQLSREARQLVERGVSELPMSEEEAAAIESMAEQNPDTGETIPGTLALLEEGPDGLPRLDSRLRKWFGIDGPEPRTVVVDGEPKTTLDAQAEKIIRDLQSGKDFTNDPAIEHAENPSISLRGIPENEKGAVNVPVPTRKPSNAYKAEFNEMVDHMLNMKTAPASTLDDMPQFSEPKSEEDLVQSIQTFLETANKKGALGDDVTTPPNSTLMAEMRQFLGVSEGAELRAYKDHNGHPTVGFGFNLDREDARSQIEKLGYDYDKVRSGEVKISEEAAEVLRDNAIMESMAAVKSKFRGAGLARHQVAALTSLHYNNPSLIGPRLTKWVKNGEWAKAADEIEYLSNKNEVYGIRLRRQREAALFRGNFFQDQQGSRIDRLAHMPGNPPIPPREPSKVEKIKRDLINTFKGV